MTFTKSLKFKISIGIVAVMLPLTLFTFYNNLNAKRIVEEKVSATYGNTLRIFTERVDDILQTMNLYLYKMDTLDADVGVIQFYPYLSNEYVLTKIRLTQKMIRDVGFYNMVNTIFLYSDQDVIYASQMNELLALSLIRDHMDELSAKAARQRPDEWHLIRDERIGGKYLLARIYQLDNGFYAGVYISLNDIAQPLDRLWNRDNIGETVIYSKNGEQLASSVSSSNIRLPLPRMIFSPEQTTYSLTDPNDDNRYLVMNQSSNVADIAYNIIISEKTLLRNIPFLQKTTYFLPLGIMLALLFFILYLNQIIFKPMGELIRGMKKIAIGRLDFRLRANPTTELNFVANSFNSMVEQVATLKIDVYEEQLRVQKAEFNQLQAQISPHFFMNSLNIIYNFAALGDQESVKQMSLHLADYFRFIMRTNRSTVMVSEELHHIRNYIEIQKARFPGKLDYRESFEPELLSMQIPALSLQPFIENAIIHGFKKRKETFCITVEGTREDERWRVAITDNGVGFSDDVLATLNEGRQLAPADSSRLGIDNIVQRLQLHFQGKLTIRFANREEGGATVTLGMPITTETEPGGN